MTRESNNAIVPETGHLVDGYDYINQAWVVGGVYQTCGHPEIGTPIPAIGEGMLFEGCECYGRLHAGQVCITDGVTGEAYGT